MICCYCAGAISPEELRLIVVEEVPEVCSCLDCALRLEEDLINLWEMIEGE